jgi:hypothetical protein
VLEKTVEDLSTSNAKFDLVLYLGVLYHTVNPIDHLKIIKEKTGRVAIVETLVDMLDTDGASSRIYPGGSLNGDFTNCFTSNIPGFLAMAEKAGWTKVELRNIRDVNTVQTLGQENDSLCKKVSSGRAVFHLYQ